MARRVEEWIGKTDDAKIPAHVKDRIFKRCDGRCQDCNRILDGINKPEFDHIEALINNGRHAEFNLQTLCDLCHGTKTKADVGEKSRVYQKRSKHLGLRGPRRTIPGKRFNGDPIPSRWVTS